MLKSFLLLIVAILIAFYALTISKKTTSLKPDTPKITLPEFGGATIK